MKKEYFYNIFYSLLIFIFMIAFGKVSIFKAIMYSGILFVIVTLALFIKKDYLKGIVYLLGFCLPINMNFYYNNFYPDVNVSGALVGWKITLYDILILMFLVVAFKKGKNKIKFNITILLVLIYLAINILSLTVAFNVEAACFEVIRISKCVLLFWGILKVFNYKLYCEFIDGLGGAVIVQCTLGILQILKGGSLGLSFLGESDRVFRAGVVGLEKGMSGTLAHPGTMAIFILFCLTMIIFNKDIKFRKIYIGFSVVAIILSFARTSIVLMCGVILVYCLLNENKFKLTYKKLIFMVVLAISLVIGIIIFQEKIEVVLNRFINSDFSYQIAGRGSHSEIAKTMYEQRENWAYGANNYIFISKDMYPIQYAAGIFNYIFPVHNLYYLYLIELGICGVVVYILLNLTCVVNLIRRFFVKGCSKQYKSMLLSASIWISIIMAYNFTGWSGAKDMLLYCMWITIGISEIAIKKVNS